MASSMSVCACVLLAVVPFIYAQHNPNLASGRSAYVHLFEWRWTDIAAECERFLGPKGFGAIQISPPMEHRVVTDPFRPWWERYQVVSYKLQSRSGNEGELADMVRRCNDAGVRIYVDAVINHMAATEGTGSAGSYYNAGRSEYPGVPFGPNDFTPKHECNSHHGDIDNYGNAQNVRNCRLLGMPDLALYKQYTKDKVQGYMNRLIDIGVAGFRIDASKHMWPAHLEAIIGGLKNLNTEFFPAGSRPFVFHEVIDLGGEPITGSEYFGSGRVTEFKYGKFLTQGIRKQNGQQLKYYRNFGEDWGFLSGMKAVTFIDNHDNQRGHGAGGNILTFRDARLYKIANAFMLAHPYGFPQVMSSYNWDQNYQGGSDKNDWVGPPNHNGNTNGVPINADGTCGDRWVCEHRWRQITNMVGFRNVAGTGGMAHWWDNGGNQIAFGRGSIGATSAFIAINNDGYNMGVQLQTGLPPGNYCDVISGNLENGRCTGKTITVNNDRNARFDIGGGDEDPVVAIHINAKL